MMYESKGAELLPFGQFLGRLALHLLTAAGALGFSLGIGMVGYSHYENMEHPVERFGPLRISVHVFPPSVVR